MTSCFPGVVSAILGKFLLFLILYRNNSNGGNYDKIIVVQKSRSGFSN
jgi:hypothetical protein